MDFDVIAKIISQDVSLMNGVLKLVNLEAEQNRVEVTSIKEAFLKLSFRNAFIHERRVKINFMIAIKLLDAKYYPIITTIFNKAL